MSITDKAHRVVSSRAQSEGNSPKGIQSSTLVVISPTLKRLKGVMSQFSSFVIHSGDDKQRRMQRVLNIVMSEAVDELGDVDEIVMQSWLVYMARTVEWVGSGDMTVLP